MDYAFSQCDVPSHYRDKDDVSGGDPALDPVNKALNVIITAFLIIYFPVMQHSLF